MVHAVLTSTGMSSCRKHRWGLACVAWLALMCAGAPAAEARAALPDDRRETNSEAPGRFAVGPFFITPLFQVRSLGVDTNVFYTSVHRRTDFTASGGPGLEVVLPGSPLRFELEGALNYLYFLRTTSQRRFGGVARTRMAWQAGRLQAEIEQGYSRSFERQGFEVDERVLREAWLTHASTVLRLGRLLVETSVAREENNVPEEHTFLGTDLRTTLSRERFTVVAGLRYRLTTKTSVLVAGDTQTQRYPFGPGRDNDSNRLYVGINLESRSRLSGRAVTGVRWLRPRDRSVGDERAIYANVGLTWHFGPRTRVHGRLVRDLAVSAFSSDTKLPSFVQLDQELRVERDLTHALDAGLFAQRVRLEARTPVTLSQPESGSQTLKRDDRLWRMGATIGYRFRRRLRVAVIAGITTRESNFADLGIRGLLLGAEVNFVP